MTGIRVSGLAALNRKLERIEVAMTRTATDAALEGAEQVAEDARSRVPVRSGELRQSIDFGKGEGPGEARAGTNLWRAHFTEFGTVNQSEQPYLFPAFEANREDIVNRIIAAKLRGAIRGAAR